MTPLCERELYAYDDKMGWGTPAALEHSKRGPDALPESLTVLRIGQLTPENIAKARTIALFSDFSVAVTPTSTGVHQSLYQTFAAKPEYRSLDELVELQKLNNDQSQLNRRARMAFVPESLTVSSSYISWSHRETYSFPGAYNAIDVDGTMSVLPANTVDASNHQMTILVLRKYLLPHLGELPLADLAAMCDDLVPFRRFTRFLNKKLREIAVCESERAVLALFDEIDDKADELTIQSRKLTAMKAFAGVSATALGVVLPLLHFGDPSLRPLAGFVGSASVLGLLKAIADSMGESATLRKSEYYIPYSLRNAKP